MPDPSLIRPPKKRPESRLSLKAAAEAQTEGVIFRKIIRTSLAFKILNLQQEAFQKVLKGPLNKRGRKAGEPSVVLQKEHGLDVKNCGGGTILVQRGLFNFWGISVHFTPFRLE